MKTQPNCNDFTRKVSAHAPLALCDGTTKRYSLSRQAMYLKNCYRTIIIQYSLLKNPYFFRYLNEENNDLLLLYTCLLYNTIANKTKTTVSLPEVWYNIIGCQNVREWFDFILHITSSYWKVEGETSEMWLG